MIKRYRVSEDFYDLSVVMDVDTSKLTPELATEINNFWSNADSRLAAADDDVVMAVVRLAGAHFIVGVADPNGGSISELQRDLDQSEGWPPNGEHGIRLIAFDGCPDFEFADLVVTEVSP